MPASRLYETSGQFLGMTPPDTQDKWDVQRKKTLLARERMV